MKQCIHFAWLVLVCLFPCHCFGSDRLIEGEEARVLLQRIKQSQESQVTVIGSFREERTITTMPAPLVFTGKVYAKPPGFLFLAYEEPISHIMKVTGDTVLFYVDGAATADQVNLAMAGDGGGHPDLFTWSPADFKGEIVEKDTGYMLHNPEIKVGDRNIRITLDKESLMIHDIYLLEPCGDGTRIVMTDLRVNEHIPEEILQYSLPAGVTVNNLGQ